MFINMENGKVENIWPEHLREVAINLIKDRGDMINAYLEREDELDAFDEQRRKK